MTLVNSAPLLLLAVAISSTWAPSVRVGRLPLPAFIFPFIAAIAAGLGVGLLTPVAVVPLTLLPAAAFASKSANGRITRALLTTLAVSIALLMALHLAPGFANPKLLDATKLSPDSAAFTQYLNFDKGAAGLIILAAYAPRAVSAAELGRVLKTGAVFSAVLVSVVMGLAVLLGYVHPDVKLPPFTLAFLATNLFFTCVAEEAFFRGFLQVRLAHLLYRSALGWWGPVFITGLLFGAAHASGGSMLLSIATVAGVGYSIVFAKTGRIEAPITAHVAVNAVQFLCFSYPYAV